jgi:hypothetical protein
MNKSSEDVDGGGVTDIYNGMDHAAAASADQATDVAHAAELAADAAQVAGASSDSSNSSMNASFSSSSQTKIIVQTSTGAAQ